MQCDVPEDLGRPLQLIMRDRYGTDIDVLDIGGPASGAQGVHLLEGYSGFYHAERTQVDSDEGAYSEGATPTPFPRVGVRRFKFTLGIQANSAGQLEDIETRLWRFLRFERDCVIRVYSERSPWREAWRVRLTQKPDDQLTRVPGLIKFAVWEVQAAAYDPWWHSELLQHTVRKGDFTTEIDPATGAVSPGSGVIECRVPVLNPADTRCFPQFASNSIEADTTVWLPDGLTDNMVAVPTLGVGKEFLVQTDPLMPTLMVADGGQDWANMTITGGFASWIRPGKVTPVSQRIWIQGGTDDTEITAYYPQSWDRMYGGETPPHLEDVEWTGVPDM